MLKLIKSTAFIILPFLVGLTILWAIRGKDINIIEWTLRQIEQFADKTFWEILVESFDEFIIAWNKLWAEEGNILLDILRGIGAIALTFYYSIAFVIKLGIWFVGLLTQVFKMIGTLI